MRPCILVLDAHYLPSALTRSFMAVAISWRSRTSPRVPVPSLQHAVAPTSVSPSRLDFRLFACGKLSGGICRGTAQAQSVPAPVSFRLMSAVPCRAARFPTPRHCLSASYACRAADRDGVAVEQSTEVEGHSSTSPSNGDLLRSPALERNDFARENVGGIHVIIGPMFAGKTTALLQRIREEADAGRYLSVCFLKISAEIIPITSLSKYWHLANVVSFGPCGMPLFLLPSIRGIVANCRIAHTIEHRAATGIVTCYISRTESFCYRLF